MASVSQPPPAVQGQSSTQKEHPLLKWIPDPNTARGFLAGVAFATLFHQRVTVFFEGLVFGIIVVIIAVCFALLQPESEDKQQGIQSVSASQAIFHEGTVDSNSISALVKKTKILEEAKDHNSKKSYDVLGGTVPLGFLDGDAVLGNTTLDEAEIAFQKFRDRAKDRSRILKSMNTWIKDLAEVERTHGKALDKLAVLATTTIVNKLAESEADSTSALPTTNAASYTELPKVPSKNPHLLPTSSARADEPRYYDEDRPSLPGPSPLQHWWRSIASHTRHRAKEALALSAMSASSVGASQDLANAVAQLQAEQSLLEKRCSAQGTLLCKELRDAMVAKNSCDREHARAEDRLRVHVEHVSHTNQEKQAGLSRTASTPVMDREWIKLAKQASEAETKRNDVSRMAQTVRTRFETKMPVILHDFALIDHNLQVQCQSALLRFASNAKDVMIPTLKSQLQLEEDLGADPFADSLQDMLSKHQVDLPHIATILPALKQSDWLPVDDALPSQIYARQRPSSPPSPAMSSKPHPASSGSSYFNLNPSSSSFSSPPPSSSSRSTSPVMSSTAHSSSQSNKLRSPASQARMFLEADDDADIPQTSQSLKKKASKAHMSDTDNVRMLFPGDDGSMRGGSRSRSGSDARGGSLSRVPSMRGGSRSRSGSDARGGSLSRRNSDAGDLAGMDSAASGVFLGRQGRIKSGPVLNMDVESAEGRRSPMNASSKNISPSRLKSVKDLFPPVNNAATMVKEKKLESKKSSLSMLKKNEVEKNKDQEKKKKKKGKGAVVGSEWDDDGDLSDSDINKKTKGGMDMSSFAAAALAATLPATLPPIPPDSVGNVGEETCVWLNAFLGRIYRDAARSPHYHLWFAARIEESLNKGWANRPDFVDEMKVTVNGFGPTPPLLTAARWLPTSAMENADLEYDLAMNAKFRFRGALAFTVETKFWINWPREKYASIPLQVHIRMTEMAGAVRMGVRRNKSFVSFLAEPFSIFEVDSTIGKHETKFRQLQRLDAIIVGRIKSVIARKLVWPNCKHFRLLWPKSWWPAEAVPQAPQPTSTASFSSASSPTNKDTTPATPFTPTNTAASAATSAPESSGTPLFTRCHSDTPISGGRDSNSTPSGKMTRKMKKQLESTKSFQNLMNPSSSNDLSATPREKRRAARAERKASQALFRSHNRSAKKQSRADLLGEGADMGDMDDFNTPRRGGAAGVLRGRIGLVRLWRRIKSPNAHNKSFSQLDLNPSERLGSDGEYSEMSPDEQTQTSEGMNSPNRPNRSIKASGNNRSAFYSPEPALQMVSHNADNMKNFNILVHSLVHDMAAEKRYNELTGGGALASITASTPSGNSSGSKGLEFELSSNTSRRRVTMDSPGEVTNRWQGLFSATGANEALSESFDDRDLEGREGNDVAIGSEDEAEELVSKGSLLSGGGSNYPMPTSRYSSMPRPSAVTRAATTYLSGDSDEDGEAMHHNGSDNGSAINLANKLLKRRHSVSDFRTISLFQLLADSHEEEDSEDESEEETSEEEEEEEESEGEEEAHVVDDVDDFERSLEQDSDSEEENNLSAPLNKSGQAVIGEEESGQPTKRSWGSRWRGLRQTAAQKTSNILDRRRNRAADRKGRRGGGDGGPRSDSLGRHDSSDDEQNKAQDKANLSEEETSSSLSRKPSRQMYPQRSISMGDTPHTHMALAELELHGDDDSDSDESVFAVKENNLFSTPSQKKNERTSSPQQSPPPSKLAKDLLKKTDSVSQKKKEPTSPTIAPPSAVTKRDISVAMPDLKLPSKQVKPTTAAIGRRERAQRDDAHLGDESSIDTASSISSKASSSTTSVTATAASTATSFISKAAAKARSKNMKRTVSEKKAPSAPLTSSPSSSKSKATASSSVSHLNRSASHADIFKGKFDIRDMPLCLENVITKRRLFADSSNGWFDGSGYGAMPSSGNRENYDDEEDEISGGGGGGEMALDQLWWFLEQNSSNMKLPVGMEEHSGVYRIANAESGRQLFAKSHKPNRRMISKDPYIWERELGCGPKGVSSKENAWVVHIPSQALLFSLSESNNMKLFIDREEADKVCYVLLVNLESQRTLYSLPLPEEGLKAYHTKPKTKNEQKVLNKMAKLNPSLLRKEVDQLDYSYGLGAVPNERLKAGGGSEHLLKNCLWRLVVPTKSDVLRLKNKSSSPSSPGFASSSKHAQSSLNQLQSLAFTKGFDDSDGEYSDDDDDDDDEEEDELDEDDGKRRQSFSI